jgi:serine/threonine-protein kinase
MMTAHIDACASIVMYACAVVTTLAGGIGGSNGAFTDGTGSNAGFYRPQGLAIDPSGNIFVADTYNHLIRRVTPVGGMWVGG